MIKTLADTIHDLENFLDWARQHPDLPAPYPITITWYGFGQDKAWLRPFVYA